MLLKRGEATYLGIGFIQTPRASRSPEVGMSYVKGVRGERGEVREERERSESGVSERSEKSEMAVCQTKWYV